MDKKGVLGLDTVKLVVLGLLVLAVIAIAGYAVLSPMQTAVENLDSQSGSIVNETSGVINETGVYLSVSTLRNPVCSITAISNATTQMVIGKGNYTITDVGCKIAFDPAGHVAWNNTAVNVTYTYTYDRMAYNQIVSNMSYAPTQFFNNSPTFFVLLGVVILILIIAIVIMAVSRFGGGNVAGHMGEREHEANL